MAVSKPARSIDSNSTWLKGAINALYSVRESDGAKIHIYDAHHLR